MSAHYRLFSVIMCEESWCPINLKNTNENWRKYEGNQGYKHQFSYNILLGT